MSRLWSTECLLIVILSGPIEMYSMPNGVQDPGAEEEGSGGESGEEHSEAEEDEESDELTNEEEVD